MMRPKHIKASSLIETLTALVVITITFSVGFMIFSNLSKSVRFQQKVRAKQLCMHYINETLNTREFFNQERLEQGIRIISTFKDYHESPDVVHMHILALAQDQKILFQYHQLINDAQP